MYTKDQLNEMYKTLGKNKYVFLQSLVSIQTIHSLDEHIDTFVAKFIPAAGSYYQCILRDLLR